MHFLKKEKQILQVNYNKIKDFKMFVKAKDGTEINYNIIMGKGPTLVFLPGILGDKNTFSFIVEQLNNFFTCVVIELVGQGTTKISTRNKIEQYSIEQHTEDVYSVIKSLNIEKFSIIGLSFGSLVATNFAYKYPEYVNHVILLAGVLCNTTNLYKMWNKLWQNIVNDIDNFSLLTLNLVYSENFISKNPNILIDLKNKLIYFDELKKRAFVFNLKQTIKFNLDSVFKEINKKIICIHGEEDLIHPINAIKIFLDQMSNYDLITVPEVGHGLHLEIPIFISEKIKEITLENFIKK